jgi:hypothetical protein
VILISFVFIADASLSLRVIPELLNRRSHGFPKSRNKFCAFAQHFDRAREMSRERSRGQSGTIEIGPVEPRELGAPGSRDGFAREHSGIAQSSVDPPFCPKLLTQSQKMATL